MAGGVANGLDALLSTVQMPKGIPVATVAIGGARNAALLAGRILALTDPAIAAAIAADRSAIVEEAAAADSDLQAEWAGRDTP
jgi:5-(carboxyamino)imidazole ribonucleotide mutase